MIGCGLGRRFCGEPIEPANWYSDVDSVWVDPPNRGAESVLFIDISVELAEVVLAI